MKKVSENVKAFLDFCSNAQSASRFESNEIQRYEQATQDLLHQLELGSYSERRKTATRLANTRKDRRYSKDVVALLQPLTDLLNSSEGVKFMRGLMDVLGRTRKLEHTMENRQYFPRVITDIEIAQRSPTEK